MMFLSSYVQVEPVCLSSGSSVFTTFIVWPPLVTPPFGGVGYVLHQLLGRNGLVLSVCFGFLLLNVILYVVECRIKPAVE